SRCKKPATQRKPTRTGCRESIAWGFYYVKALTSATELKSRLDCRHLHLQGPACSVATGECPQAWLGGWENRPKNLRHFLQGESDRNGIRGSEYHSFTDLKASRVRARSGLGCAVEPSIQTAGTARLRRVSQLNAKSGNVESSIGSGDECTVVSFS